MFLTEKTNSVRFGPISLTKLHSSPEAFAAEVTAALVSSLEGLSDLPAVDVLAVEVGHVAGVELVVRLRLLLAHHAGRRRKGLSCISK